VWSSHVWAKLFGCWLFGFVPGIPCYLCRHELNGTCRVSLPSASAIYSYFAFGTERNYLRNLLIFLGCSSIIQHWFNTFYVQQGTRCCEKYINKHFINFLALTCFIFKLATLFQLCKLTTVLCVLISFTTLLKNFKNLSDLSRCTLKYGSAKFGQGASQVNFVWFLLPLPIRQFCGRTMASRECLALIYH